MHADPFARISAIVLACTLAPIFAAEYPPLPAAIKSAKTIYMVNAAGDYGVFDNLYSRLKKWGRWSVTAEPQEADLFLVFSERNDWSVIQLPGRTTTTAAAASAPGAAAAAVTTTTSPGTPLFIGSMPRYLAIVDPISKTQLLFVSCERRLTAGYTAGVLVNRLRKRIEKAAK